MTLGKRTIPVQFTGDTLEYFGIWIVNFLLSVVTLGVYSAWAKVRNKKYLLRNVTVDGRAFDYHARGWDILVGRFVAVAMTVAWFWLILIPTSSAAVLAFKTFLPIAALPWLINHSLRFNAAMTSWSNVRFRFGGDYWTTLAVFLLLPFLATFTLFLTAPFVIRGQIRYVIGELRLGGVRFAFDGGIEPFIAATVLTVLWAFGVLIVFSLFGGFSWNFFCEQPCLEWDPSDGIGTWVLGGLAIGLCVAFLTSFTVFSSCIRNALYAGITLKGGHQLESRVSEMRLVWISISNAVLVVASLGMLQPWAQIRLVRYLCAHTWTHPTGSLDDFVGKADRRPTALGDAFMEILGLDV